MQTVSDNWKNAHKQTLLNESFVEVSLNITDPEALADASPQDNGAIYISNSEELAVGNDKSISPYCTLEQNLWCLDGSRKAIPESDFGDNGYVSDALSDDTCIFSVKLPIITVEFSKVFSKLVPGVTIVWSNTYGEFADTFEIVAYNGDTIVASQEVTKNRSVKSIVLMDIAGYDKIAIVIKKWCLPNHRARVEEIFVGLKKVYGKTDLFNYSHSQSVDLLSTRLPKNEIKFSINNVERDFDPYDSTGLSRYLMDRQELKVRYGLKTDTDKIEWIKGGTFYLSEWYAKQNGLTADFTARDSLEFMSSPYTENHDLSSRSLYALAETILAKANLPALSNGSDRWYIDESLKTLFTTAPLPNDTLANSLQLIANAGMCVLYQDRNGTLRIERLTDEVTDYRIDSSNSYSNPEVTLPKPIRTTYIKVYTYSKVGDEIKSSTTDFRMIGGNENGEDITIDNPLITYTNDDDIVKYCGWLTQWMYYRKTLDFSWRPDVRIDALDSVTSSDKYKTKQARMTDIEFKYNGAFRATGKGVI